MKRTFAFSTALLLALGACGGSDAGNGETEMASEAAAEPAAQEPAADAAGSMELQMPEWFQYDEAANAVTIELVAGSNSDNNYWNYNGYENGEVTVVVPAGAEVTVNFSNEDPNLAHSVGIAAFSSNPPASLDPEPVFAGAISSNPTSMTEGTLTGESESITFTADAAGEYSLACYIPGHAVSGMWIGFTVSDAGEAGVRGAL